MTHFYTLRLHCIHCGLYNLDVRKKSESRQLIFACHHCQDELAKVMTVCECRTTQQIEFPRVGALLRHMGNCDSDPWATSSIRKAQKANKLKRGLRDHQNRSTVGNRVERVM